jgi:hypothetical protein
MGLSRRSDAHTVGEWDGSHPAHDTEADGQRDTFHGSSGPPGAQLEIYNIFTQLQYTKLFIHFYCFDWGRRPHVLVCVHVYFLFHVHAHVLVHTSVHVCAHAPAHFCVSCTQKNFATQKYIFVHCTGDMYKDGFE